MLVQVFLQSLVLVFQILKGFDAFDLDVADGIGIDKMFESRLFVGDVCLKSLLDADECFVFVTPFFGFHFVFFVSHCLFNSLEFPFQPVGEWFCLVIVVGLITYLEFLQFSSILFEDFPVSR